MKKNSRPVFLNLFQIEFPAPAIVSILHRITGVITFLSLPLYLWLLHHSLTSETAYTDFTQSHHPLLKFILWIGLSSILFHTIAGIRHLVMDLGWGESLKAGRRSAYFVLITSAICAILAGVWI